MEPKYIILICAIVAVAAIAVILLLVLNLRSNKKTQSDLITASKDLISSNAQAIEVLLVLAKGKEKTISELKELQDKIKYLTPSVDEKVKAIDEKIGDILGDCKIELNKRKEEEKDEKVFALFENIRLKLAERSTLTDRL